VPAHVGGQLRRPGDVIPADPSGGAADAQPIDESCPTSNTISFAKTKFLLHRGLAFGAFHRYLYKRTRPAPSRRAPTGGSRRSQGRPRALFIKARSVASQDVKANPTCARRSRPARKIGDGSSRVRQAQVRRRQRGDQRELPGVLVEGSSGKDGVAITENDNPDLTSTPN